MERLNLFDTQRVTAAKEITEALEGEPSKGDATIQEITRDLEEGRRLVKAWQTKEVQLSRMIGADEDLDDCFRGLDYSLLALACRASVMKDEAVLEGAKRTRKTLFPEGLTAVIHVPYQAEASEAKSFQERSEESSIQEFLKKQGLLEWLVLIQKALQEYNQALEESEGSQEEKKKLSQDAKKGRKLLDQGFERLWGYLYAKYPDGHPQEAWRKSVLDDPLKQAQIAADAKRSARAKERSSKAPVS